ncbi:TPA: ParA family protein, partial [Aeromonas hydrophila]
SSVGAKAYLALAGEILRRQEQERQVTIADRESI